MLERKREAIGKAEREGRYQGRVPTVRRQYAEIIRLKEAGIGPWEIPSKLGDRRASVYRVLGAQNHHRATGLLHHVTRSSLRC